MAKTIKFNLICDGKPIRTIEDLQNNFSIEDVLAYYSNKLLHRWLTVRGYIEELDAVNSISTISKPIDTIKQLIKIFNIEIDEVTVCQNVYMLEYLNTQKKQCDMFKEDNYRMNKVIRDYINTYEELIDEIVQNQSDVAKIKSIMLNISINYKDIFVYNRRDALDYLCSAAPIAVYCMLMNDFYRDSYLPVIVTNEDGEQVYDTVCNKYKSDMYNKICSIATISNMEKTLGNNMLSYSGVTEGYWKDLEPSDKKYMILNIEKGNYVRSAGKTGEELNFIDVNNKFIIVNGIDYKSNSSSQRLLYIEV